MPTYAVRRRSFLAGLGGAFGFQILLDNLEAAAEGAAPPPRLLVAHFPGGTLRHHFLPSAPTATPLDSRILKPFDTPELRAETIALFGLTHDGMTGEGDPHARGLIFSTTGSNSPGIQSGPFPDPCAGGPSWDQRFLRNVSALAKRDANGTVIGRGYYNVSGRVPPADSRASGCLSYGYTKTSVSTDDGGSLQVNSALSPTVAPLTTYNDLFSGFTPDTTPNAAVRALIMRKSVLDSALRELARVRELAPASEWVKIDAHAETVRQLEAALSEQITGMGDASRCMPPPPPQRALNGSRPSDPLRDYNNPVAAASPDVTLLVRAHASILCAAFACDLIRVATLQWLPAAHDATLDISDPSFFTGAPPTSGSAEYDRYEALANAHVAINESMAAVVSEFRAQKDPLDSIPATLLDRTVIPFVTEVAHCGHEPEPMPAVIFGGRLIGMRGGQFQSFESSPRPHNDLWVTVAQALFRSSEPLAALADEDFVKNGVAPIPGLYYPS